VDESPKRLKPDRVWVIDGTTGSRAVPGCFRPPESGLSSESLLPVRVAISGVYGGRYMAELEAPARGKPTCRPREIRELTGFGWEPNITAEQGRALS
jgi:hypothetical protein